MLTLPDLTDKQLDKGVRGQLTAYRPGESFTLDTGDDTLEVDLTLDEFLQREVDSIFADTELGSTVLFETDPAESIRWPEGLPRPDKAWAVVVNPVQERARPFMAASLMAATRAAATSQVRSLITRSSGNGGQYGSRDGATVDTFQIHHAAATNLAQVLSMMSTGSRQVSANFVIMDDQIIEVVPIGYRAWTSGSASWDKRSVTVEIINSSVGSNDSNWQISDASYRSLARLAAALNIDFPAYQLTRNRTIPHRDLWAVYGASYPTACPSGVSVERIITEAKGQPTENAPLNLGDTMYAVEVTDLGRIYLVTPNFVRWTGKSAAVAGMNRMTGRPTVKMPFSEFYPLWEEINAGNLTDSVLMGQDEYAKLDEGTKAILKLAQERGLTAAK